MSQINLECEGKKLDVKTQQSKDEAFEFYGEIRL